MLPTFEVDAHRLRPVRAEDAEALGRHWDHLDVRRFLFDGCEVSAADAQALVAECIADAERACYGMWVIEQRRSVGTTCPDRPPLGMCALRASSQPSVAPVEVIYSLAPSHWGRGVATTAAQAVVAYALGPLELPSVGAVVDEGNVASAAVLRRLGMVRVPGADEVGPLGPLLWWRRTAGGDARPGEVSPPGSRPR